MNPWEFLCILLKAINYIMLSPDSFLIQKQNIWELKSIKKLVKPPFELNLNTVHHTFIVWPTEVVVLLLFVSYALVIACPFCIFGPIFSCESTQFHLMCRQKRSLHFLPDLSRSSITHIFLNKVKDRGSLQARSRGGFVVNVTFN